ncbi:acyl-CoA dehydrogenase family protein [Desulforhabdus amnigena]|jgi:alkylation response protein AidB-like acyl-CoA dehydrogenase|uniref:Acyl-CoA dehydrogenase n=1 Tax=Desulforhabdus amnigena TaxID=40218 RepID=A0A9W6FRK3_9BACT|nr:acyl-CoA dehydrogenase family protein [Desulforhabdus amnigena]NLJ29649.1 acyl-CoA dehydrogenase [Deltaproteobacteria bacterium]GLI33079.1 acyl-CoA dehydrogenase [Desulforhabdus amnigena]
MDFNFSEEQEMLRETIQKFCRNELSKEKVRWMDENCNFVPDDIWNGLVDLGVHGLCIPEQYGGLGQGHVDQMVVMEELATASAAVALGVGATLSFGATPLVHLGTEEQKERHLPRIAQGSEKWAMALTEPEGGTDILGAMRTRAEDKGDHWLLNGRKIFITGAHVADYIMTVAITDPEAKRANGLSVFIVPRETAGLETRLIPKLGCHACGANFVYYDDVRIPKENLLGTLNDGWRGLLNVLNPERIGTAVLSLGVAKAAFRDAFEYAKERNAFGGPIARFQSLQHYLADIAIEIENARNLVYKCAWLADQGKPMHIEACMAKIVAARASEKAAIWGMEILGGYGYTMEYDMQRYFRDYKQMVFSPISDEMAKNMIMQFMGYPKSW